MRKRNTRDDSFEENRAQDPTDPANGDEPVTLSAELDMSGASRLTAAVAPAIRTSGPRSRSGPSSGKGSMKAALASTTARPEVRIRAPVMVAMARRQAEAAGCKDTTRHVENLILANERSRGAGLRLAREVGRIGLALSALHEDLRDRDLASPEILAALDSIMQGVGKILADRLGRGPGPQAGPVATPSRPPRQRGLADPAS